MRSDAFARCREDDKQEEGDEPSQERGEVLPARVLAETISRFEIDHFLPVPESRPEVLARSLPRWSWPREEGGEAGVPLSELMPAFRHERGTRPGPPERHAAVGAGNRPDLARQQCRAALNVAEKRVAATLLHTLAGAAGGDLRPVLGRGKEKNNYEVLIRLVHRRLNALLGKEGSNSRRHTWSRAELQAAMAQLDHLRDALLQEVRNTVWAEDQQRGRAAQTVGRGEG